MNGASYRLDRRRAVPREFSGRGSGYADAAPGAGVRVTRIAAEPTVLTRRLASLQWGLISRSAAKSRTLSILDAKQNPPMNRTIAHILVASTAALPTLAFSAEVQEAEMAGYLLVSTDKVPDAYNAGFSLYTAAWPLLQQYPGHRFQTGLFGTWMHAQYEGKPPADLYSDIEGGLGWWRDTRFPTETPKFIMGGVAVNFQEIANGPAHGRGTWDKPQGLYGVAQLEPLAAFPDRRPERQAGHLRRPVRLWLSAAAADGGQADHRRKERPDRRQLLDPVPQHQELQRPGVFLHALLLVALRRSESELCRSAAGFAPLGPEQALPDGDPVCSGCGDVHALLALAGGFDHRAVSFDDGFVEERLGLLPPDFQPHGVEHVLQAIDVGRVEAAAKIACGSGIGNAARTENIEVGLITTEQFQVFQARPSGEQVVGDIEHVVRIEVRQMDLQQAKASIDGLVKSKFLHQQVDGSDTSGGRGPACDQQFHSGCSKQS